jgi:hypothetical protein
VAANAAPRRQDADNDHARRGDHRYPKDIADPKDLGSPKHLSGPGEFDRRRRARNWALLLVLLGLSALFYAITLVKLTKGG